MTLRHDKLYVGSVVVDCGRLDSSSESLFLTRDRDHIGASSGQIPQQFTTGDTFCTMDCSEEVQSVSEEPFAQIELKKGMSIFIDVSNCFNAHLRVQNVFHVHS